MLCKCHWIVLYTVHFTAFCLGGGGVFFPDTVHMLCLFCEGHVCLLCVFAGHESCVELLLEHYQRQDFVGNTFSPLHCAV